MPGLSTYNSSWDQTRANQAAEYVYEDDSIIIATDFEGGNGNKIQRSGNALYELDLEPEPGDNPYGYSGIAYYVCFGVRSKTRTTQQIHVRLNGKCKGVENFSAQKHMVVRRGGRWDQLPAECIRQVMHKGEAVLDSLEIELSLPPVSESDPALFISNFHWWPNSEVAAYLHKLDGAIPVVIGTSFLGKPIYALELGNRSPQAPCMVNAATSQPSEMGHLACRALIDFLLSDDPEAHRILEQFHICFVPAPNPDGNVLGNGLVDAQGRFQYFEGHFAANEDPRASPETVALWQYLKKKNPTLFWEWHSNNWFRRRGNMLLRYRPELINNIEIGRKWRHLDELLLKLPDTFHESWTSHEEGPYQNSLGFQAVTKLGSISHMIKHHDKYPLQETASHAVECLKSAALALL